MSMGLQSPCYDRGTQTDCPNRGLGCRNDCAEWKQFEAAKREEYRTKMVQHERESDEVLYWLSVKKRLKRNRNT
jgi:hypothetical protein